MWREVLGYVLLGVFILELSIIVGYALKDYFTSQEDEDDCEV